MEDVRLSVALGRPAPLLERLELQECTECFPFGFLGDHAPNLRTLVLPRQSLRQDVQYPALRQVTAVDVRLSDPDILPVLFEQCPQVTTIVEVARTHASHQDRIPNRIQALHAVDYRDSQASLSVLLGMLAHRNIATISLYEPQPHTVATALEGLHVISHVRVSWNMAPYSYRQRWWIELVDERGHVRTFHFDDMDPAWHLACRLKTDFAVSWSLRSFSIALPGGLHQELPTLTYNLRAVETLSIGIASADDLDVPHFITDFPAIRHVHVTALLNPIRLSAVALDEFMRELMERIGQRPIDVLHLDNITIEATPESADCQSPLAGLVQTIVETNNGWESAAVVSIV